MGEVHHDAASLAEEAVEHFGVLKLHAAHDFPVGDVEQFQGLDEVVGKVAVELPFDAAQFGVGFFRKRGREVAAHHLAAVADHVVKYGGGYVGQQVKDRQRE